jgi:hypothetical protein
LTRLAALENLVKGGQAVAQPVQKKQASAYPAPPRQEEAPFPATLGQTTEAGAEKPAVAAPFFEAGSIWQKTLEQLLAQSKRMLHAYASQGKATGLADGILRVEFDNANTAKRLQEKDYHAIIEKLASGLAGQPIKVAFINSGAEDGGPAKERAPAKQKLPPDGEIADVLKDALAVFGGEIIKNR